MTQSLAVMDLWDPQTVATTVGALRNQLRTIGTYELLCHVWEIAAREDPCIGANGLLERASRSLEVQQQRHAPLPRDPRT